MRSIRASNIWKVAGIIIKGMKIYSEGEWIEDDWKLSNNLKLQTRRVEDNSPGAGCLYRANDNELVLILSLKIPPAE